MPEGPEVLMMTKLLTRLRDEIKITLFDRYLNRELRKYDDLRKFAEKTHVFKRVFKKGKHTFVEFENADSQIKNIIHLRYGLRGEITEEKTEYTKLIFGTTDGLVNLYFNDQIGYGDISVLNPDEAKEVLDNIGPNVENLANFEQYYDQVSLYNGKKPIAELLVNQSYISGIGNYLRSEILYDARVYPLKKSSEVTKEEHMRIYESIKKIWKRVLSDYPDYQCRAYGNPQFASEKLGNGLVYFDPKIVLM